MQAVTMNNVSLFSRKGCHLCERAEDLVSMYFPGCPVFDVDADEQHRRLYGMRVPVLVVGGEVVLADNSRNSVARLSFKLNPRRIPR